VINWTSLFVNGIINFVIPIMLFLWSRRGSTAARHARTAGVQTMGQHGATILTAEVPSGFALNDEHSHEHKIFRALPVGRFAKVLAVVMAFLFSAAIIGAIVLAILEEAGFKVAR
jgi:hypothetical protein